jgi:uncharacterized membrane protein YGL010W
MNGYFKRQLVDYVEYHRDPWNCAMHVFGIVFLFLAAILPLSLWPVEGLGIRTTVATVLTLPVLVYWLLLDVALGAAIVAVAFAMLSLATAIVNSTSVASVWGLSAALGLIGFALQFVGHKYFERRQPSMVDNPSHFLLGPMFVMAKMFIALGFRNDLDAILRKAPGIVPTSDSSGLKEREIEPRAHT